MIIDTLSIIGITVAVVMAVLSLWCSPFRRKLRVATVESSAGPQPLSLILMTHGNTQALADCLPLWLNQEYAADLQIIVVVDEGDHQTEDIIKRLSGSHRLYSTFVPQSSRYMSRRKLAVTLGVKAARHDWVLLADADCRPASPQCLTAIMSHCQPETVNLTMVPVYYDEASRGFYQFERLHRALYYIGRALRGRAYSTNAHCLVFRKNQFMDGQGFLGSLHLLWGEYATLVNKYATPHATAIALEKEARLTQRKPATAEWRKDQVRTFDTNRHLGHGGLYHAVYRLDQTALYLAYLLQVAISVYGALTQRWVMMGVAIAMLILTVVVRFLWIRRTIHTLNIPMKLWATPFYELRITGHNALTWLRHRMTDKTEFTSHKL